MKIEIFSDIACPWCYVGKRRLEQALDNFAHRDQVEISWKSYELAPQMPEELAISSIDYLVEKGIPRDRVLAMREQCLQAGAAAGLAMNFDKARKFNTRRGHELLHYAATQGRQTEMMERLFAGSFVEGRALGGIDALVEIAAEAGLNPAGARAALESGQFTQAVIADEREAEASGVRGVPYFVFNRKYALSGGQDPAVFLQALEAVWQEERGAIEPQHGVSCTDDSCAV